MDSPVSLDLVLPIGAALLAGLAILTLMFAARSLAARDTSVDSRITAYLGGGHAERSITLNDQQIAERLNEVIKRQSFAARIEQDLAAASLPLTVPEYLLIRIATPLIVTLLALLIWRQVPVVPAALIAGHLALSFWMRVRRQRRKQEFSDQLPETLDLITASMRGGFSLVQSLANVASDVQEPMRTELRRVFQEVQLGLSVTQALDNLVQRMESTDFDLVVTAIKIHARVGGNLGQILENISTTMRERAKLRREVRVITSMQRISSYIIGALPFALALIIFTINPTYMMRLFQPGLILCIPIGAFISSVVGFLIIRKIVDVRV
jgi:tight adherence protein B